MSVYRDGMFLDDLSNIITANSNITLRCLGHAPSNVVNLTWVLEPEGGSPMTLDPENNNNYTIVSYGYNEANLTIVSFRQPYRGVVKCKSPPSGVQASFFVMDGELVSHPPPSCYKLIYFLPRTISRRMG